MLNTYATAFVLQDNKNDNHSTETPPLLRQHISKSYTSNNTKRISLSQASQQLSQSLLSPKPPSNAPNFQISIGDKVKISAINKKTQKQLTDAKGTVMYIGYPFIGHGIRYGIHLDKAIGDNKGSLVFDIESGKIAKKTRFKKSVKSLQKRKFFKSKRKHGIFVKKREITSVVRLSHLSTRFSIGDKVEVRYGHGIGRIKFIGALQHIPDMGIWYGIQLTERIGKHNGTINGVRYFQCPLQYGILCRQNHLILIESKMDQKTAELKLQKSNDSFNQPSNKWAKIMMGPKKASQMTGFKTEPQQTKSAMLLNVPKINQIQKYTSDSTDASVIELEKMMTMASADWSKRVSVLNLTGQLRPTLSPNILPLYDASSKLKLPNEPESINEHRSFVRGQTMYICPNPKQFKQRKFSDFYALNEFEDELGEGEFGVVYKCRPIETKENEPSLTFQTSVSVTDHYNGVSDSDSVQYPGDGTESELSDSDHHISDDCEEEQLYAVKKIKKAKFHHLAHKDKQNAIRLLRQEIKLLEKIGRLKKKKSDLEGSKYVIDLIDVFEDRNYLYLVTNYCSGGTLWQFIEENDEAHSEQRIQIIMKQILEGLAFLHSVNMAHLDIKPDNIMMNHNNEIQLIDFGMSRVIPPLIKAKLLVGTGNFVAPEVIDGFYDKKADIWSVGVIFFLLRFGYPPFFDSNEANNLGDHSSLFAKIRKGFNPIVQNGLGPWFPSQETNVSDRLKDLLSKMLDKSLSNRLTAIECLAHPYFETLANPQRLPLTIMNAFAKFSGQCKFRVMIARLFAHQIQAQQMQQLRTIWNRFDANGDGSLTLAQFKHVMNAVYSEHNYKEYQLEAIFDSLDWNETDTINFNSLLTAFSYQRLVAVDERLWEAFAKLDMDSDGHITKAEIKRVISRVNPGAFSNEASLQMETSVFISDCITDVDWDDDGQVNYEEFLRALHPSFNEENVTPRALQTPSVSSQLGKGKRRAFVFQPSIISGTMNQNCSSDTYLKYRNHKKHSMNISS